ncbi:MAG TPA: CHASE2 domain-containing protein [Terracidiphilus sp.]|jgi:hypothetical protein|nr:CHASE2 domain-containing protein [Terracidiphilus sp.]
MMNSDDILNREINRLGDLVDSRKFSFLPRLSYSRPALIAIAAVVLVFQMRNFPEELANSSLDAAISVQRPVAARSVRLVTIADDDYASLFHSRSPLDPPILSKILMAVAAAHPRAIVVDIDTEDPSFRNMETPAVPIVWNVSGTELKDGKFNIAAPLGGRALPAGSVSALAMAPRDDRGIVRGYQHTYPLEDGRTVDSPGYAAARIASGHAPEEANHHPGEVHFLDYSYQFVPLKASELLDDAASSAWNQMALFNRQVVVVGGTYRVGRDQYATPKGQMDGCEIVAQAASAEIDGTFITPASRWLTGLLLILGGLATLVVYHWLSFRLAFVVSLLMVPALSIAANWILFHRFATWGAMVPLVIAVIVAELYSKATLFMAFYHKVAKLKTKEGTAAVAEEAAAKSR